MSATDTAPPAAPPFRTPLRRRLVKAARGALEAFGAVCLLTAVVVGIGWSGDPQGDPDLAAAQGTYERTAVRACPSERDVLRPPAEGAPLSPVLTARQYDCLTQKLIEASRREPRP